MQGPPPEERVGPFDTEVVHATDVLDAVSAVPADRPFPCLSGGLLPAEDIGSGGQSGLLGFHP
eukprot:9564825-Lingulodinium_polyedra.AAC.1